MGRFQHDAPLNVLLVEDHPGDRRLLTKRLEPYAVVVHEAASLSRAIEAVYGVSPDVALLDLGLPDSRGLETLERFRAEHSGTPVVVLTGSTDESLGIQTLRQGAEDFFSKDDLDPAQLYRRLRYAFERNRLERHMLNSTWQQAGPLLITNADFEVVFANRSACDLLSRSAQSLIGERLAPGDPVRIEGEDGSERYVALSASATRWRDEGAYLLSVTDITERVRADALAKRAEQVEREKRFLERERDGLLQQEYQLHTILAETGDFVGAAALDLATRYINPAGLELLGYERDEQVFGLSLLDLCAPEERMRVQNDVVADLYSDGRWTGPIELQSRSGARVVVDAVCRLHRRADASPSFISIIARDITDRAAIEERLREAQKIEAVGRLAGGIAHDFNNLLTAISSFGRFALETVGPHHEVYPDLEEIMNAAEKAEGLTRQLLAFSRKQAVAPKTFPVASLVSDMKRMLQRLLREDIVLETHLPSSPWNVRVDPGAMEQVLINLCVNARDAMPNGGRLTVAVSNETLDAVPSMEFVGGEYVRLTVSDEGTGITPEVMPRIFEPFYTTKEQGKGTGLGLSTCHGIVAQAGGHLDVESELGRGTSFSVFLPRVSERADPEPSARPSSPRVGPATGSVLVAEDNEQVRRLAARILERRGYRVHAVADGAEALRVLEEPDHGFDLVLTDVVMPVMGGRELARHARAAQPNLRIAFMSGFADDELESERVADELLLAKPFTPPELLEHVRAALRQPSADLRSA